MFIWIQNIWDTGFFRNRKLEYQLFFPVSDDTPSEDIGRIQGSESVTFDISGNSGTLVIEADRLGV